MSDRRAGWVIVIVSAALGVVVCFIAFSEVGQGALEDAANAGDAAIALLLMAAPSILTIVALDVIACFMSTDLRVRLVAAAVAVLTIVGVLIAGAIAAERTDPPASAYWAAAGNAPGPFDCAALNSDTPTEIQAILDALEHPGRVDIYFAADDSCAGMLRGIRSEHVVADYASQLQSAGWAVDTRNGEWLTAERGRYAFWVMSCYPEVTETAVAIFEVDERYGLSCDDSTG